MNEGHDAFDGFLEHVLDELSLRVPEFPTQMGLFETSGTRIPQDRFTDISDAAALDRQQTLRNLSSRLAEFEHDQLSSEQRTTAEVLGFFFDYVHERDWIGIKGEDFLHHEYLIRPSVGLQSDLPLFLSDLHPMRHQQDAMDYVDRLRFIAPMLSEAGDLIVERQHNGLLPPTFLIRDTIREISEFTAIEARDNIVCRTFAEKSEELPDVSAAQRERMLASIEKEIRDTTYPAYSQLANTLSLQEKAAYDDPGLWRLPNGEAYYDFLLHAATTTALSASEIHEIGLAETEKLEEEIISASSNLGYNIHNIGDCHRLLNADQKHSRSESVETPQDIVDKVESLIASIEGHLPSLFHHLPTSKVMVKPIPEFAESSRNQSYQPPSLDGSRPGLFELNVGQLLEAGKFDTELPTLVYHEIYPGHHLQLALAMETEALPMARRIITFDAYIEGWAKYAEELPWTQGINTDPHWRLARMHRELISTVNLVLDTGIHAMRWGVKQSMDFLQDHTGLGEAFTRYLVHRSASVPAQMCSYKIGMLKMLELRDKMSKAQGASFDIRDFHDVILRNGAVPLKVLDTIVDREIEISSRPATT